jgi:hypothetical protein
VCDCEEKGCGRCTDFPLDQCTPARPLCTGAAAGYLTIQRSDSQSFLARAYLDSACSIEIVRTVIRCGECNGRVRVQCGSHDGMPGWAIALIVMVILGAMGAALGAAIVAYLVYRRRQLAAAPAPNYTALSVQGESLLAEDSCQDE